MINIESKQEIFAHIRKYDGSPQSLTRHCCAVSELSQKSLKPLGLGVVGALAGILHDMGKATEAFQTYLKASATQTEGKRLSSQPHAPVGAIFAYERWFSKGGFVEKLTAQIISMAVYGHHAGLQDCLDEKGVSPFLFPFTPEEKEQLHYREAAERYLREVADLRELDALFECAHGEMQAAVKRLDVQNQEELFSQLGLVARMVLSAVVDADRWDSACFENDVDSLAAGEAGPDWNAMFTTFEAYRTRTFTARGVLNDIRARISDDCLLRAPDESGVFRLTVPTGGGKTFSTFRFALKHAALHDMQRVVYVIPFNTILDQNAADIRNALGSDWDILEHHSGIVHDSEEDEAEYRILTERWDSPVILTSMVQFLNALYRRENTDARRMRALVRSVLIFDEVQALPKRCTRLFEKAIRFLVRFCGCTVVLCTATQPSLALPAREMIRDVSGLFTQMRRVHFVDQSRAAIPYEEAARRLARLMDRHGSMLVVVNTKVAAQELYDRMRIALPNAVCRHLSTNMCPAHRLAILDEVKERTRKEMHQPTLLISTALIEAGINISFPAVVRSLAGLSSVIQAAGRCNRNAEEETGTVYLWKLSEENLTQLEEIRAGQELSDAFLRRYNDRLDHIGDSDVLSVYFENERKRFERVLDYPYPAWSSNLCDMLSLNGKCTSAAKDIRTRVCERLALPQSFRTAGEIFQVIDQSTRAVLVPYGEGREIIRRLYARHDLREEIRLLRCAQRFSVNVYDQVFRTLTENGALAGIGDSGAVALRPEYYDDEKGISPEPGEMDLLYD